MKDFPFNEIYVKALEMFTTEEIIPTPFPGQELLELHSSLNKWDQYSFKSYDEEKEMYVNSYLVL